MSDNCPKCYNPISESRGDRGSQGVDEHGDPFPFWSDDPVLTPLGLAGDDYKGTSIIRYIHIQELREYYNALEVDLELTPTTWTDDLTDTTKKFVLKHVHIEELRESIEGILTEKGLTIEDYFSLDRYGNEIVTDQTDWTDVDRDNVGSLPLLPINTIIKAIHIEDLRRGIFTVFAEEGRIKYQTTEVTYDGITTSDINFPDYEVDLFGTWGRRKLITHNINNLHYSSEVRPSGSHEFENSVEDIYTYTTPIISIFEKLEETNDNYKFKLTNKVTVQQTSPTYIQLFVKLTPTNPTYIEYSNAYIPFHADTNNKIEGIVSRHLTGYTPLGKGIYEARIKFRFLESRIIYVPRNLVYYPYIKYNSVSCAGYSVNVNKELEYDQPVSSYSSGSVFTPEGGCYTSVQSIKYTYYYKVTIAGGYQTDYISTGYTWEGETWEWDYTTLKAAISAMSQWEDWLTGGFSASFTSKAYFLKSGELVPFDFTISGQSI